MNNRWVYGRRALLAGLLIALACGASHAAKRDRVFNGPYTGEHLNRVAFPIGGLGAGMFCLEGTGAISHMSVEHQMDFFNEPYCYASLCVLGKDGKENTARVIEGPIPDWKYFGRPGTGNGARNWAYGFPRFRKAQFNARFPFATIDLSDPAMPVDVKITGWSPFTPPDPDPSSLPVGALEYEFTNTSDQPQKMIFGFNSENFLNSRKGSIGPIENGFVLYKTTGVRRDQNGAFAVFVDGDETVVDHCWFRGRWFDSQTVAWENVKNGRLVNNPAQPDDARGASLFVPFELAPGQKKTIKLLTAWYFPKSDLHVGQRAAGAAFRKAPSKGTAKNQQTVRGFLGKGLVNTFDPGGDSAKGSLTSPKFSADKRYLHFLVGGGKSISRTCVRLLVDRADAKFILENIPCQSTGDKVILSAPGNESETLTWSTFDLNKLKLQGKQLQIELVDQEGSHWGHLLADHFVLSDEPIDKLKTGQGNAITDDTDRVTVLQDFEGKDYGKWTAESPVATCSCSGGECAFDPDPPETYVPWYSTKYKSIQALAADWKERYNDLRSESAKFRDAFYDSTLPPEVVEAVAANITILKSPTVLRQHDGRLWCWEGCCDGHGCCAGSCTHVWNYAQAICHLFPSMERTLRRNEFFEGQDASGRQAFRGNLPITPGGYAFDASDGQLGGIMKAYREWKISGDKKWLTTFWPKIKKSLDYMIAKWDPRHTGLLEEVHHNTYDINYYGPDGHCGSFYLGALAAAIKMGEEMGDDVSLYRELLTKGRKRMEKELYNGEYFIQIVQKEGLDNNFKPTPPSEQSPAYRDIARRINEEGPKYQYGTGCLSDGVLGLWMAAVCGLDDEIVDTKMIRSHLKAVHKHNLKEDLSTHANPQRPSFAMGDDGGLLLCSWPRGNKPLLPFVYSDEVWTGIEYQVASHLMLLGCVDEGLDIVQACRKRYDGVRRNPFNEYECGHWYARAMSAYGLLQGMTGVWYDPATKTLYANAQNGDFRTFLSTATGYGTVELKDGQLTLEVKSGKIPVEKKVVTGK
ncbi:MAG: hypothetical protein JW818_19640 [Pirellulales bacterium]|nr:hypothetical protein [Pirellulales bacterium]